jgi:hypothetical protein
MNTRLTSVGPGLANSERIVATLPNRVMCGVEMWRGGVGAAYLLPTLSLAGASLLS